MIQQQSEVDQHKTATMFFREMFAGTVGHKLILEPAYKRTCYADSDIEKVAIEARKRPDLGFKICTIDWSKMEPRWKEKNGYATGEKPEVAELVAITADVDAEKPDYPSRRIALAALDGMPCKPSYIIESNGEIGGYHAYWLFDTPISAEQIERIEVLSERWQAMLRRTIVLLSPGIEKPLDQTHSPNRVLRCPGSMRAKSGKFVRVYKRLADDAGEVVRYSVEELERQEARLRPPEAEPPRPQYKSSVSDDNKPIPKYLEAKRIDIRSILLDARWKNLGNGKWQQERSESGEHSAVEYEVDGKLGLTIHSGGCGLKQFDWYSPERLFVAFNFSDDQDGWRRAADFCKEELDRDRDALLGAVDLSGLDSQPTKTVSGGADNPQDPQIEVQEPAEDIPVQTASKYETPEIPEKIEVVSPNTLEEFLKFPVDMLPPGMREFVREGAEAIGCDETLIALPTLTLTAGMIGIARRLEVKSGWSEPCILWTAPIGESGTQKTPAFNYSKAPFQRIQTEWMKDNELVNSQYMTDKAIYDRDMGEWRKKKNSNEPPPTPPDPPRQRRKIIGDCTIESVVPLLKDNPTGLVAVFDELAGWFGSFDKYTNGKGSDVTHWLSMFNGGSVTVDRKHGIPKTIYIPQAAISLTGGIQPSILQEMIGKHVDNGLSARLLMAYPPRISKTWKESQVKPKTIERMNQIAEYLSELPVNNSDFSDSISITLKLTAKARDLFIAFYNQHNTEQTELRGALCNAWSKLECYVPRIALLHHLVRVADRDTSVDGSEVVDFQSMSAAIGIVEWFKRETRRIHQSIGLTPEQKEEADVYQALSEFSVEVTARDLMKKVHRKVDDIEHLEAVIGRLVRNGRILKIEFPPSATGGRPTWKYKIKS